MSTAGGSLAIESERGEGRCDSAGVAELAPIKIADFLRIRYGGTSDVKRRLGPIPAIRDAFVDIQVHLFR